MRRSARRRRQHERGADGLGTDLPAVAVSVQVDDHGRRHPCDGQAHSGDECVLIDVLGYRDGRYQLAEQRSVVGRLGSGGGVGEHPLHIAGGAGEGWHAGLEVEPAELAGRQLGECGVDSVGHCCGLFRSRRRRVGTDRSVGTVGVRCSVPSDLLA